MIHSKSKKKSTQVFLWMSSLLILVACSGQRQESGDNHLTQTQDDHFEIPTANTIFLREGFESAWRAETLAGVQNSDSLWLPYLIKENNTAWRICKIFKKYKGCKYKIWPGKWREKHFSLLIPFYLRSTSYDSQMIEVDLRPKHTRVLLLAGLNLNWEVYVNGEILGRSFQTEDLDNGFHYFTRKPVFVLHRDLLRSGNNTLLIHLIGDPAYDTLGVGPGKPVQIIDVDQISSSRSEHLRSGVIILGTIAGILFLFVYLVWQKKKNITYLYFSFFAMLSAIYMLSVSIWIQNYIKEFEYLYRIEIFSLFMIFSAFSFFVESFLKGQVSSISKLILGVHLLLLIGAQFVNPARVLRLLYLWEFSMVIGGIRILLMTLVDFWQRVSVRINQPLVGSGARAEKEKWPAGTLKSLWYCSWYSTSGNLLVGIFLLITAALLQIYDTNFGNRDWDLIPPGLLAFLLGVTLVMVNRLIFMNNEVSRLNYQVIDTTRHLQSARSREVTEREKYRRLTEDIEDILFVMNRDWVLLNANRSFFRQTGKCYLDLEKGLNLIDIVHFGPGQSGGADIQKLYLHDMMDEFIIEKKPISRRLWIRSAYAGDWQLIQLRLEMLQVDKRIEILARATPAHRDELLAQIKIEHQYFIIESRLSQAEIISDRLTQNLDHYLDPNRVQVIRFALREMISNAIEHGSLEIGQQAKYIALAEGRYKELIRDRLAKIKYQKRRVHIWYFLRPEQVRFIIADEGPGFDWQNFLNSIIKDKNKPGQAFDEIMSERSRGIRMTLKAFDEVEYNPLGNRVKLSIKLNERKK